jgi:hypothetical protein
MEHGKSANEIITDATETLDKARLVVLELQDQVKREKQINFKFGFSWWIFQYMCLNTNAGFVGDFAAKDIHNLLRGDIEENCIFQWAKEAVQMKRWPLTNDDVNEEEMKFFNEFIQDAKEIQKRNRA